eukprot:CAMPEP_0179058316 /NCGR_PEP_ID=MMETSP0796-20121207/24788_1 /TAXON_ID=73915 /ORGANISM="Pyrodinium bahamense, Strain pbaha01" /LENGTH=58 /DNA_ID=CAMNT_0020755065 /DNA_START=222 /DNA_END=395 /DNA_ORIENTATION=+
MSSSSSTPDFLANRRPEHPRSCGHSNPGARTASDGICRDPVQRPSPPPPPPPPPPPRP